MSKIAFELVAPDKSIFSGKVDMVIVPGANGYFGVMDEHAPFATSLKSGLLGIYTDGKLKDRLYLKSGFADVKNNQCTILVEDAISLGKIDLEKLRKDVLEMESDKEEAETLQAKNLREMLDAIQEADLLYPAHMN